MFNPRCRNPPPPLRLSAEAHYQYIKAETTDALVMLGYSMRRHFGTMPHNRARFEGLVADGGTEHGYAIYSNVVLG